MSRPATLLLLAMSTLVAACGLFIGLEDQRLRPTDAGADAITESGTPGDAGDAAEN